MSRLSLLLLALLPGLLPAQQTIIPRYRAAELGVEGLEARPGGGVGGVLETEDLAERGRWHDALLNIVGPVVGGFVLAAAGFAAGAALS